MGELGFPFPDHAVPVINDNVNNGLQILFIFNMVLLKTFLWIVLKYSYFLMLIKTVKLKGLTQHQKTDLQY